MRDRTHTTRPPRTEHTARARHTRRTRAARTLRARYARAAREQPPATDAKPPYSPSGHELPLIRQSDKMCAEVQKSC